MDPQSISHSIGACSQNRGHQTRRSDTCQSPIMFAKQAGHWGVWRRANSKFWCWRQMRWQFPLPARPYRTMNVRPKSRKDEHSSRMGDCDWLRRCHHDFGLARPPVFWLCRAKVHQRDGDGRSRQRWGYARAQPITDLTPGLELGSDKQATST